MNQTVLPVSPHYRDTFHLALVQQIPWAVLCLLMLDGGHLAKICGIAMLAFWLFALTCMARRPMLPTRFDIACIRWGFFPLFGFVWAVAAFGFGRG